MARVALVSGGTRGIGAAISKALVEAGYRVAATYAGNVAAADAFRAKTGIDVYRWDVGSFEACTRGIREVPPVRSNSLSIMQASSATAPCIR
jgi:acetoacetyl-CoA reductase